MKNKPYTGPGYWERVRDRAAELGTDGCTGGSAAFRECCFEHDIHWRTGKTLDGMPITPREANTRLRSCVQARSRFGWWSPVAWWRFAVVSVIRQPKEQSDEVVAASSEVGGGAGAGMARQEDREEARD